MGVQDSNLELQHDSLMTVARLPPLFVINVTYFKTIL
jgi:hypothetical protein